MQCWSSPSRSTIEANIAFIKMKHNVSDDKAYVEIDYRHFHLAKERRLFIHMSKLMKRNTLLMPPTLITVFGKKHLVTFKHNLKRAWRDLGSKTPEMKYWCYEYTDSDLMAPGESALYTVHVQDDSRPEYGQQPFPDGCMYEE